MVRAPQLLSAEKTSIPGFYQNAIFEPFDGGPATARSNVFENLISGQKLVMDLNAFTQVSRHFHALSNRDLYRTTTKSSPGKAMAWAVEKGKETSASKLLQLCGLKILDDLVLKGQSASNNYFYPTVFNMTPKKKEICSKEHLLLQSQNTVAIFVLTAFVVWSRAWE